MKVWDSAMYANQVSSETDIFTALEDAITERISPLEVFGLQIVNRPQPLKVQMRAQCLVYLLSVVDESPGAGGRMNSALLTYALNIQLSDMRQHKNAYPFLTEARRLLQGWKPDVAGNVGRLFQQSIDYQPQLDAERFVWSYSVNYGVTILY